MLKRAGKEGVKGAIKGVIMLYLPAGLAAGVEYFMSTMSNVVGGDIRVFVPTMFGGPGMVSMLEAFEDPAIVGSIISPVVSVGLSFMGSRFCPIPLDPAVPHDPADDKDSARGAGWGCTLGNLASASFGVDDGVPSMSRDFGRFIWTGALDEVACAVGGDLVADVAVEKICGIVGRFWSSIKNAFVPKKPDMVLPSRM
jgi:hypothetical protein